MTGSSVAARALAAGMMNESTRLTANIAQITPFTVVARHQCRSDSARRRSSPAACMMAAKMNAARHRNATGVTNPLAAAGNGLTALVITRSIGMSSPETPTGIASKIHIRHAQTITASAAWPAGLRPCGVGMT